MGCSTSSQTSAVDSTKPGVKPEETNGTIATVTANGNVAEDIETIPDQTSTTQTPTESSDAKPADETPTETTTTTAPPPVQEEQLQLTDVEPEAGPPAETSATPVTAPPEATPTQAETTDSTEPKHETTEEAPASNE
ncbi:uncharacterized protein LOC130910983 [Corythoichthys intestinalis]|uniref:uncharacterized protein LOC130910983 n=1 Tax=Corythoichthys intestinalis TaxID=161448 RepID=UPI0025A61AA5|nr:uncharacterized protein LOC130910983 [Corythoichthys intestinalis]